MAVTQELKSYPGDGCDKEHRWDTKVDEIGCDGFILRKKRNKHQKPAGQMSGKGGKGRISHLEPGYLKAANLRNGDF